MINHLSKENHGGAIVASIVAALAVLIAGLTAALVLTIRARSESSEPRGVTPEGPLAPHYLLVDAAAGLKQTSSALRLSNSEISAAGTVKDALMYATRAETALECEMGDYAAERGREQFLNDATALLMRPDPMHAVEKADELYRLAAAFYDSVGGAGEFVYNGELSDETASDGVDAGDAGDADAAAELLRTVVGGDPVLIGSYDGKHEFTVNDGYATVAGGKVTEFAFPHSASDGDPRKAQALALETAEKCGFDGLFVYATEQSDGGLSVKMCCACGGALCRDECAVAVVAGDKVVAFTAGKCGTEHELPAIKYTEEQARINAENGGEGRLVTVNDGERDRICYEYRYELDDGEHFVYVCAENGMQMSLR